MEVPECAECGEPLDDLECHHHNTEESADSYADATYVMCQDCPAWWPVKVGLD